MKYRPNPFIDGVLTFHEGERPPYGYIGVDMYGKKYRSPVRYATKEEAAQALKRRMFHKNPSDASTPYGGKPASWILRDKRTKKVIMETFDEKKVKALNREKYEAVPIMQYLQELNGPYKKNPAKAKGELQSAIFDARRFKTYSACTKWLSEHLLPVPMGGKITREKNFIHIRLRHPGQYARIRTKRAGKFVQLRFGFK
jgi:hypothetical protein